MSEEVLPTEPTTPTPAGPSGARVRWMSPFLVGAILGVLVILALAAALARRWSGSAARPASLSGQALPMVGRGAEGQPSVLSPVGTIPHGSLVFHWEPVSGIEEYEVVVYDPQGAVQWRSGKLRTDSVDASSIASRRLMMRARYFWRVIGYGKDGQETPSRLVQFIINP